MCKEVDEPKQKKGKQSPQKQAKPAKPQKESPAASADHAPAQAREVEMEPVHHVTPVPLGISPEQEANLIKMEGGDSSASSSVDTDLSSETTTTTAA